MAHIGGDDSSLIKHILPTPPMEPTTYLRLRNLAMVELSEGDAQRHWRAISRHCRNLERKLERDVPLPVAVLDYFLAVYPRFSNPTIVEQSDFESIRRSAIMDPLTGLFNRRYFEAALDGEIHRCLRYRSAFSLLLLDVDNLKELNDKHGHPAGDKALAAVGRVIRKHMRAVDIPCRYGGDEFAVLLPDTDGAAAHAVADRLASDVGEDVDAVPVNGHTVRLSISGGLATHATRGECSRADIIALADAALYAAKWAGGNRILRSDQLGDGSRDRTEAAG